MPPSVHTFEMSAFVSKFFLHSQNVYPKCPTDIPLSLRDNVPVTTSKHSVLWASTIRNKGAPFQFYPTYRAPCIHAFHRVPFLSTFSRHLSLLTSALTSWLCHICTAGIVCLSGKCTSGSWKESLKGSERAIGIRNRCARHRSDYIVYKLFTLSPLSLHENVPETSAMSRWNWVSEGTERCAQWRILYVSPSFQPLFLLNSPCCFKNKSVWVSIKS